MTNPRNLRITLTVAAVAITSVIVLSSWNNVNNNWNDKTYTINDTVPKKEKKIRDLDDVIDELGSRDAIRYVHTILEKGTGADRQLAIYQQSGKFEPVVDYIIAQTKQGI